MDDLQANFGEHERVRRYIEQGPPAFAPGHSGMLQMAAVLLSKRMPDTAKYSSSGRVAAWRYATWRASSQGGASSGSIRPR